MRMLVDEFFGLNSNSVKFKICCDTSEKECKRLSWYGDSLMSMFLTNRIYKSSVHFLPELMARKKSLYTANSSIAMFFASAVDSSPFVPHLPVTEHHHHHSLCAQTYGVIFQALLALTFQLHGSTRVEQCIDTYCAWVDRNIPFKNIPVADIQMWNDSLGIFRDTIHLEDGQDASQCGDILKSKVLTWVKVIKSVSMDRESLIAENERQDEIKRIAVAVAHENYLTMVTKTARKAELHGAIAAQALQTQNIVTPLSQQQSKVSLSSVNPREIFTSSSANRIETPNALKGSTIVVTPPTATSLADTATHHFNPRTASSRLWNYLPNRYAKESMLAMKASMGVLENPFTIYGNVRVEHPLGVPNDGSDGRPILSRKVVWARYKEAKRREAEVKLAEEAPVLAAETADAVSRSEVTEDECSESVAAASQCGRSADTTLEAASSAESSPCSSPKMGSSQMCHFDGRPAAAAKRGEYPPYLDRYTSESGSATVEHKSDCGGLLAACWAGEWRPLDLR